MLWPAPMNSAPPRRENADTPSFRGKGWLFLFLSRQDAGIFAAERIRPRRPRSPTRVVRLQPRAIRSPRRNKLGTCFGSRGRLAASPAGLSALDAPLAFGPTVTVMSSEVFWSWGTATTEARAAKSPVALDQA